MSHKIFLSHNHQDKPIVEPVALKLAEIFGANEVFYDSWSIKPGDGIIDQMTKGLEAPEYVFFFVSEKSLASGMVKLEWQNALHSATRGKTKIIPVRVDGSDMPSVLKQTLFIDMYTVGLEAAIAQIVSVTQGNASFTPQHQGFSNLTYEIASLGDGSLELIIRASHLLEPNPQFLIATLNKEEEIQWSAVNQQPFMGGYNKDFLSNPQGQKCHAIAYKPMAGALTPKHPIRIKLERKGTAPIDVVSVLHESAEGSWTDVPRKV